MKTATDKLTEAQEMLVTFSSLYVGMKTATDTQGHPRMGEEDFQFPIRWDEDCNSRGGRYPPLRASIAFSSLYVGMKTATLPSG